MLPFPVVEIVSNAATKYQRLYIQFIVNSMSPISVVEDESFGKLVIGLNSDAPVITRKTARSLLEAEVHQMRSSIKKKLLSVPHVACTADIWSTKTCSFLGITAHWLDPKSLGRKSCIWEVFLDYDVQKKVVAVATDNGINFAKAFTKFGSEGDNEEEVETLEIGGQSFNFPGHIRCASHTLSLVGTKGPRILSKLDFQPRVLKNL